MKRETEEKAMEHETISRRWFLKTGVMGLVGLLGSVDGGWERWVEAAQQRQPGTRGAKSRVVVVTNKAINAPRLNSQEVKHAVHQAVCQLMGVEKMEEAWARVAGPEDVVAVKINGSGGSPNNVTHREVVFAIVEGLSRAGVEENNIIVYDQATRSLLTAGLRINKGRTGVRCYAAPPFAARPTRIGSVVQRFSRILTEECTVLINVPCLKTTAGMGVTIALKNHQGSIQNPKANHPNNGDPYLADLNCAPAIRRKTRLVLCDATYPLYHGGPGEDPRYHWPFNGILASLDPVALDTIGWWILRRHRDAVARRPAPLAAKPHYIATAAARGLGTNDPQRIELKQVDLS
ncbi:MAG TPA: DUF362 domain-containing protein [Armatimonadetes bacterium]|nr:DUF362 domain-containing protein [Armatimonadota bacterium]